MRSARRIRSPFCTRHFPLDRFNVHIALSPSNVRGADLTPKVRHFLSLSLQSALRRVSGAKLSKAQVKHDGAWPSADGRVAVSRWMGGRQQMTGDRQQMDGWPSADGWVIVTCWALHPPEVFPESNSVQTLQ